MRTSQKLAELQVLAKLILDSKLVAVQTASAAREITLKRISALSQGPAALGGDQDIGSVVLALQYARWADMRRAKLNQKLASQTAEWLDSCDAARNAFGRAQTLGELTAKKNKDLRK